MPLHSQPACLAWLCPKAPLVSSPQGSGLAPVSRPPRLWRVPRQLQRPRQGACKCAELDGLVAWAHGLPSSTSLVESCRMACKQRLCGSATRVRCLGESSQLRRWMGVLLASATLLSALVACKSACGTGALAPHGALGFSLLCMPSWSPQRGAGPGAHRWAAVLTWCSNPWAGRHPARLRTSQTCGVPHLACWAR